MVSSFNQDLEKGTNSSGDLMDTITASPTALEEENIDSKDYNANTTPGVLRVRTSDSGDLIHLGNQCFHKSELLNAFAGDFNPGIHHAPNRPMGNPVPLGLAGYAICTFTVGLVFLEARGVSNAQLLAGPSLFFGGLITLISGLWCLVIENTFAATALGGFGGFYLSYAGILIDAFGVASAYADNPSEFNNIMGFFLIGWCIFAFSMWLCTFKGTWPFFLIIGFIDIYLILLTISYFSNNLEVRKGAGAFAVLSAVVAFYAIFEGNATPQNSYVIPPQIPLPYAPRV